MNGRNEQDNNFLSEREHMVEHQIQHRGVTSERVLEAFRKVPRHAFVSGDSGHAAYADHPLPIGEGQTISQPYIVAFMTELLQLTGNERVLEIGTGSGYQTAILAECAREVYTIEVHPGLGEKANTVLHKLGYRNIHIRIGDGKEGWPDQAPFERIILTASPATIPRQITEQLGDPGILVSPVGQGLQKLVRITREFGKLEEESVLSVSFVPLV